MSFPASTIKSYFQTGDKPNQAQFESFIDAVADIDANAPLSNFTATSNPTANNDSTEGYSVGSNWVNTSTGDVFICVDASDGVANWAAVQTSALSLGALAYKNTIATADIDNAAVTLAKIQDVSTATILGRGDAGTGDVEQLSLAAGFSASAGSISAVGAADNTGYVSSRYYGPFGGTLGGGATLALTGNRLYGTIIAITRTETFTRIGLECTTLEAGKSARIGIYRFVGGIPTSLVLDAGTVSLASTGLKEITISQLLTPGIYVLAVVSDATGTAALRKPAFSNGIVDQIIGISGSVVGTSNIEAGFYGSHTFGALPSTFPTITYSGTEFVSTWLRKV